MKKKLQRFLLIKKLIYTVGLKIKKRRGFSYLIILCRIIPRQSITTKLINGNFFTILSFYGSKISSNLDLTFKKFLAVLF